MTLENKQIPSIIHVARLKPAWIRCGTEVVNNIEDLRKHSGKFTAKQVNSDQTDTQMAKTTSPQLTPATYNIKKMRYKCGNLQVLLGTNSCIKHNLWFSVTENSNCLPEIPSVKTVGSLQKFIRHLSN